MIGQVVTDPKTGEPVDGNGKALTPSEYQPSKEVKGLFSRVQIDYQQAYALQMYPFPEFDGCSLLERARKDQQTFATFVGCEYVPRSRSWRFRGRKNTARNKIIGILAHVLAGMLYPFVYAKNEEGEEDKMAAQVMRILIEDCLRKAKYEVKFMNMALSALVNPAVFVTPEWITAMQTVKAKMEDGSYEMKEVIDEVVSGLNLHVIPIDEILLGDFYTPNVQSQPFIIRVQRIPFAQARKIYGGKHFVNGKDQFDYVQAGLTRIVSAGADNQTLFDIQWTEADANCVQVITAFYRADDLEVTFVGGVFMGETDDIYNHNPFIHRRFSVYGEEWCTIPLYPFAKSGFEPLDPAGRFAYYKSAAFKEYWDDRALNTMHRLAMDGTTLEVFKPMFISGVAKVDNTVIAPGAVAGMPMGAKADMFSIGANLKAAYDAIDMQRRDMSESTQDPIMTGQVEKGVTAYATSRAEQNARIFLGVFGLMIADLVTQVGELCMDLVLSHVTTGQMDAAVPGALSMKFRTYLARGKEKGKDVTHKITFTDEFMGRKMTERQIEDRSWDLYNETGSSPSERLYSDKRMYRVNPYQFAHLQYSMYIDPDRIIRKSMGLDREEKDRALAVLTSPLVAPFTDQKAVVDDFAIDVYGGNDPDRYKRKETGGEDMLNAMMLPQRPGSPPVPGATAGAAVPPPINSQTTLA